MIEQTVSELTQLIGTRPACRALGASHATIYRRRRPPEPRPKRPHPAPARALSEPEREAVLAELHSERFVDAAPEAVWATLLDEGTYLCSPRTMYRLLAASGELRERRDQLTHPAYERPELLAQGPNETWSESAQVAEALIAQAAEQQSIETRGRVLDADYAANPERFVRGAPKPPTLPEAAWINKPDDEEAAH